MNLYGNDRDSLRRVFFTTWRKYRQSQPLQGVEQLLVDTILLHPEYHAVLEDEDNLQRDYPPELGESNPFLHMSLHVSIEEQLSIDRPAGIRRQYERLLEMTGDRHAALHSMLECLAESIWQSQRDPTCNIDVTYLDCLDRMVNP